MDRYKFISTFLCLLSYCTCEITYEKKNKLMNGFIDFYNSLPNQIYTCDEGYLKNAQQSTELNSYEIEITLKVSDLHNLDSKKYLRCTGKVVDLDEVGISVLNHHCDDAKLGEAEVNELQKSVAVIVEAPAATIVRKPIQLDNEVQTNIAATSGEQFIAIPREEQKVSCIGCASHVNPQAPGVSDLASIGVRQLDSLEPNVKHTLNTVVDVERQVQVVNGIRYILTLIIDYNNCVAPETESCINSRTCKITFLEKPWLLLPDGTKYRAVLSNNCTEQWRFGDDGMVIPNNRENNNINSPQTNDTDIVKTVSNVDVQAPPNTENTLTDDDLKVLQLQIIPSKEIEDHEDKPAPADTPEHAETTETAKKHVVKVESENQFSPNAIPKENTVKIDSLSDDKKKAIDDMLNFFNFAGVDLTRPGEETTRLKRSYDKDLNVMNLLEKFQKVKKNVENANYIYKLAQTVVDYLNEMDLEVKTRLLKDVINAEEELENHQHFYYIQSRVIIPCDKAECEKKDTIVKICNAVLDGTNKNVQILNVFCVDEPKAKPLGKINSVALDDPVLLKMVKEATSKIESESGEKALKVDKIIDANTQRVSGSLTKFSIMLDYTNCDKTVPIILRDNCTVVEELGSQICDVTVHERQWLKEKKITYACTERPVDTSFTNIRKSLVKKSPDDPAVLDMVNEALQYLDVQSNRNNKQIVVRVNSVTTQLVAGFLTDIEFVVGYTTCTNDVKHNINKCKLLKDEPVRTCKAKVWDRTWIEDGRQVDVSCKEPNMKNKNINTDEDQIKNRTKRDIVKSGAPTNKDLQSPETKSLAKEALRNYLQSSVYHRHFDVIEILHATEQVVAGKLIKLDFNISPTTCLIDKEGNPSSSDCKILDHNDVTTCSSTIWEKQWLNSKEINTTCEANFDSAGVKRELGGLEEIDRTRKVHLVGGKVEQDLNDPKYRTLAGEAMQEYLRSSGITHPHNVVSLEHVFVQVVAGKKTFITFKISPADQIDNILSCDSDIWEQPWRNFKEINVKCTEDSQPRTKREHNQESYTARRLLNYVGRDTQEDVNRPELKTLAKESLEKFLQSSGSGPHYELISIEKATVEMGSGVLTRLEFTISPTNCQVDSEGKLSSSDCEVVDAGDLVRCSSEILEKWRNSKAIDVTCHVDDLFNKVKRDFGSHIKQNPNDPEFKKLAEESMQKYLHDNGKTSPYKIVSIEKVTTQAASGTLTIIKFKISPTDQMTADIISCRAEIYKKVWSDYKEITVNCGVDNQSKIREKRGLPGGLAEKDTNDPQFRALAEESMKKFLQSSGNKNSHRILSIDKVTTQVVAGTSTEIYFRITPVNQNGDVLSCRSTIWEQPWKNFKEINVNCGVDNQSKIREKRGIPGGLTEKDTNDPQFRALAEESMKKFLQSSGNKNSHRILSIDKVTTQVVAGTSTEIYFRITPVNQNGDVLSCRSTIWEQPWKNFKEINVNCGDDTQSKIREKRGQPGGLAEQDTNDPQFRALAEESMKKFLQSSGNKNSHRILSIDKVTTQVVAGTSTEIYFRITPVNQNGDVLSCRSTIWEQPWKNFKEINVNCGVDNQSKIREKRGIPGGLTEKDTNDPQFRALAEESMKKFLQSSGNKNSHRILSIDKVTTQVVAGTSTEIYFRITPVNQNGDVLSCRSTIWEQPWKNFKEINVNCGVDNQSKIREKRGIPGGLTEKDTNDPQFRALAEESMKKFLQSSGNKNSHRILSIDKVTTQVVAGSKTEIYFRITPENQNGDVLSCKSTIWEQSWKNFKEINVNCDIVGNTRNKREIINTHTRKSAGRGLKGGTQDQDPTKVEYKELAEASLKKYLKLQKNLNLHNVVEVNKVSSKVVSGVIYYIDYTAAPKTCADDISSCTDASPSLHCTAEVWEQPWLGKREIKVSCRANNKSKIHSFDLKDIEGTMQKEEKREKRQTRPEDDYVDEDLSFYYGERAIAKLNDQSQSNNLHKLITIHGSQYSTHMNQPLVRMYIETAETYCLRHRDEGVLPDCDELDGMMHQLCLARLWPSSDDELVVKQVSVVCEDDDKFESITGLSIPQLLKASIKEIEKSPDARYKLVHQGEPQVIPTLDSRFPITLNFIVTSSNCTKDVQVDLNKPNNYNCFIDTSRPSKACQSRIWLTPNSRHIRRIKAGCDRAETRQKRSVSLNPTNATADELIIQNLVKESLHKLEMSSANRYKQRVLQINSYSSKITSGRVTMIDFDVAYTSCLKFEWVEDEKTCEFLEHLPRRHCVSQVWERLWLENGRNIEVTCEEDETPLEAHVEFESAETAMKLANEALKHIEAKYPHPRKQKIIRIFSLEKQVVAGIHYRMKVEVGSTKCSALSAETDCKLDKRVHNNRFCRVNVWLRPWTSHAPNFRVSCDYQEGATAELYHLMQAEQLFRDFLTTYKPVYIDDIKELTRKFEIFKANIRKIHELNTHEKGTARYGVTRFADLSYEEFSAKYLGLKPSLRDTNQVPMRQADIPDLRIPDKFDWRDFDAVTEVKNQGSCGSCWAFSVTGNIEGQWKMQSGNLVSLSEQELVDCDKLDQGCNGGLPDNAYRAIEQLGGLELENDYPYEGEDDKCSFNRTLSRVQITGAVNITSNETDMAKWLVQNGPISIGINANAMQFYMGGVSHPWKMLCNPGNLDHGVLIVGYGIKDYPLFHKKLPYWTIKNSWGEQWGEQGYYRVYRGDGTCGVNQMASSAVI